MTDRPTGTVTFLFTDVEGSTRLWEQHPEQMKPALARHDEILRTAIGANSGYVFSTAGDSFSAAFDRPDQAAQSAVDAQLALVEEEWVQTEIKVRMSLHTGHADERDGDYFGPALNRAARLLAIAHGGQVLVSTSAEELLQDTMPPEVTTIDLGEHRLKDLARAERAFQLAHPELDRDFPALKSLEAFTHNLPVQLTSFVGREQEIAEISKLLAGSRLVCITGVGGVGKTRVALQVAAESLNAFPNGAWLVELAPIGDAELVATQFASALGVVQQPDRSTEELLANYLSKRELLLVVDNCEHLLDSVALLVEQLLQSAPGLKVLATSREILGVGGEVAYRMRSMPRPGPGDDASGLTRYEAIRLFVERAETADPSFRLSSENAEAVIQICDRLDGMPLALELASARIRAMEPEVLASRLDDQFRLLTGGSRTALPRQQTLRATMDWSHDLLDPREQALLRRLSVFRGGFTLEAAESVCAQGDLIPEDVVDLLLSLVDKSLVTPDGGRRYRLLETVRQYAWEKLMQAGEGDQIRLAHAHWVRDFGQTIEADIYRRNHFVALERFEAELDNQRAALTWSLESGNGRLALGMMTTGVFWFYQHAAEGYEWTTKALEESSDPGEPAERAGVLANAGVMATFLGHLSIGAEKLREALALLGTVNDPGLKGVVLHYTGLNARMRGDFDHATKAMHEAFEVLPDTRFEAFQHLPLLQLSVMARYEADYDASRAYVERARDICTRFENVQGLELTSAFLASVALSENDFEEALRLDKGRSLELLPEVVQGQVLVGIAEAHIGLTQLSEARDVLIQASQLALDAAIRFNMELTLENWGQLEHANSEWKRAAHLYGSVAGYRGDRDRTFSPDRGRVHEPIIEDLRQQLSNEDFRTAWEEGASLSLEDALEQEIADA